ncbi:MAG: radical SAM family heme chaperone HemW [Lachnospiraceae bacterium]
MKKEAEIYIHIPFCVRKCDYCDFLSAPAGEEVREQYVQYLISEIKKSPWVADHVSVPTVFIGGGTPSILMSHQISQIMEAVGETFYLQKDAEITIEANPGTLTEEKLKAYRSAGINRISMGLQSAQNEELQKLGRIHTYEEFLRSFDLARKAGFDNLNVDLMSALPGQRFSTWQDTLEKVCALGPEHVSAYSLIIEEGTPFAQRYMKDEILREKGEEPQELPSEEEERRMYEYTGEYLAAKGYHRYEISNYAKEGRECKHNIGYWTRCNYMGFGLGAASLYDNIRYRNGPDLVSYMTGWEEQEAECLSTRAQETESLSVRAQETECLSVRAQMEEYMFLGLRLIKGVSKRKFKENFRKSMDEIYGEVIAKLKAEKLLQEEGDRIRLTDRGIDVSNYVLAQFLF